MRLSVFFIVLGCGIGYATSVYSQTTVLSLNVKNMTVKEVFSEIEEKTEFIIFYRDEMVDLERKTSINLKNKKIDVILDKLFEKTNNEYSISDRQITISRKPEPAPESLPSLLPVETVEIRQGVTITGKVLDADGMPMPGVNVVIKGTRRGVITNVNGDYSITVPDRDAVLVFSFVGYAPIEELVGDRREINVNLSEGTQLEEVEVVAVGYGSMLKRDVTGAITTLKSEDVEQNSGGNINTAMQGKIPGMDMVNTSGEPGAGVNIAIRGASSINGGSEPLYIIDGVIIESSNIAAIDGDATFSPIAGIDPNDIASIEVLKDAASAAIYGSSAANGVIIITTKGGQQLGIKPPTVSFNHTSSIVQNSRNLDVLNATEFRELYAEARRNNGQSAGSAWANNPFSPLYYRSTDWQDLMFRTVYQTVNNISVRGGTDNYSYGFSLGYRDLKPTVVYTGYKQYNARMNLSYKVTNWLKASTNVSFTRQDYNRILSGTDLTSVVTTIVKSNPCFVPFDYETGELTDYLGAQETRNPLALAKFVPIYFKRDWTVISQSFDATITKDLVLRISGAMEGDYLEQWSYTPRRFDQASSYPVDNGMYRKDESKQYSTDNFLTWKVNRKKHRLTAMGGMSYRMRTNETFRYSGRDYLDANVTYIQNATRYTQLPAQIISQYATLSYFTRWDYAYKDRYIMQATIRADGSSRFGPDRRWGYFPAASFGWRFSSEPFMAWAGKALYDGKVRMSAGRTGNQSIGSYAWRGGYNSASTTYDGGVAIIYEDIPNWNLHWETTTQYNAGLDLSLYKGRVNLTFDAYLKRSEGLLFNFPVSYYTGFSTKPTNFGQLENRGLEFQMETTNISSSHINGLRWRTSFNISFNRNKILRVPDGEDFTVGSLGMSLVSEGKPIGLFYAHKALGIYSRDEDNVYSGSNPNVEGQYRRGSPSGEVFAGGDVIWYDANGDGIIDDEDRVIIGDPNPKFTGGMGNTFSWKGFTLNVFFSYSYGRDVMNNFRRDRNQMALVRNTGRDVLRRWQKQGDITDRPMMRYADPMTNFRASSMWIEDGSYLRLKDVTLSYTYRPKIYVKSIKLSFTGVNLLTWSKYSGYDPEVNSSTTSLQMGIDSGAYPKARSYNFGVEFTF